MRILYTFVFLLCTLGFLNAQEVTIGSGTAQGVLPVEVYYGYTYSQVIYPSSEIGYSGNITGLKFYLPAAADISYSNEWVVYLGLTSKTSFTSDADWIATGSMTQVFSGTVTNSSGVVSITFPAFAYNTSYNLVIAVDENKDDYNDLDDEFYVHTGVTNNTIFYISDVTNPNPASPPLGTRTILRSNVTIVGIGSSCVAPSALTSSNITSTTADISWTPPSPAPSNGYEWEVRTSGVGGSGGSGLAASGSTVAGDTDDNVTGLTANTNYTLWVRSNCGGSGYSAWAGPASFTTSCGTTTVPYTQDFESATVPNLPPCTSQENVGTGNLWETTSSGWANGFDSKCLEYIYSSSEDADVWFYTQGIVMQSSKTYKISYKYGSASFDENLKVAYGTSPDDAAMTNAIADHFDVTTSPLTNEVTFTVPSDGIYYFGFNCYSSADQFALDVDDISITEVSTDAVDWCNLQDPPTGNITAGQNLTVYTQGYEPGVTESSGAGTGISAWIGYSSSNTDPSGGGWTWVPATFNVQAVNNDEFKADIGSNLAPGTYYYASRWQLNGGPYKYGGYSPPPGGGFWNGTTYVSGVLTVNPPPGADCSDPIIVNSYPYLASSTTCGAVDDYGTQCSGSYGGGEDLVYQLNITTTGNYQIIVEATNGGSWIGWFLKDGSNCANTSSCLTSATTSGTTASGSYNFTSAGTYYLIIDTYPSPTCSDFNITIAPPPINDDAPGAISLTVGSACGGADYSNYGATSNVLEPTGITTNTYATVWYKFTPDYALEKGKSKFWD